MHFLTLLLGCVVLQRGNGISFAVNPSEFDIIGQDKKHISLISFHMQSASILKRLRSALPTKVTFQPKNISHSTPQLKVCVMSFVQVQGSLTICCRYTTLMSGVSLVMFQLLRNPEFLAYYIEAVSTQSFSGPTCRVNGGN